MRLSVSRREFYRRCSRGAIDSHVRMARTWRRVPSSSNTQPRPPVSRIPTIMKRAIRTAIFRSPPLWVRTGTVVSRFTVSGHLIAMFDPAYCGRRLSSKQDRFSREQALPREKHKGGGSDSVALDAFKNRFVRETQSPEGISSKSMSGVSAPAVTTIPGRVELS